MKKIVAVSDSFKGSLSSIEICEIYKKSIHNIMPYCEVIALPVADGGEGTVDCFLYADDTKKISLKSCNAYREVQNSYYARRADCAIIEMAMCAGLPAVSDRRNPELCSTYGVGLMIKHALEAGCTEIILGLGGSATNDAGTGMAEALGIVFRDEQQEALEMNGAALAKVKHIDKSGLHPAVAKCKFTAMCDIDNPMYGKQGAAYVFAPQKGADSEMVERLDQGLRNLDRVISKELGLEVANLAGAGAAGAMGAGVVAFLAGDLRSGIEAVLDFLHFEEKLEATDLVFTGEGSLDSQSLRGKVIAGVAKRAKARSCPVVALVGTIADGAEKSYDIGVNAIFSINRKAEDFSVSAPKSKLNMAATIEDIFRLLKCIRREE